jgi:predicted RNase H-like HicB family nuclease
MGGMKLKVELFQDTETGYWCYDVPALSIIGTGCKTREDAEKYALEAIEFTLEEENDAPTEGAEVITYDVQIAKAS